MRRGNCHLGVQIEELAPEKQSCPAPVHAFEKEHVYMLSGTVTLRLGTDEHEMRSGDYVRFPADQRSGHCPTNNSSEVCR